MKINLETSHERKKAQDYLAKLIDKQAFIELREVKPRRTQSQNSYLHAIITEWACECGYSLSEMKCAVKAALGYSYVKGGVTMYKETSKMDTKELSEFTEKIRRLAADQGIELMDPDTYRQGGWKAVEARKEQLKRYL